MGAALGSQARQTLAALLRNRPAVFGALPNASPPGISSVFSARAGSAAPMPGVAPPGNLQAIATQAGQAAARPLAQKMFGRR